MRHIDKRFIEYLNIAKGFAENNRFLDTAIYTLFQNLDDDLSDKKKYVYRIKLFLFPLYVFYKYYSLKNIIRKKNLLHFPKAKVLVIVHGSGPQHYGDLKRLIEGLDRRGEKILVVCGELLPTEKEYLRSLQSVNILDQSAEAYNISIVDYINCIIKSMRLLRELLKAASIDAELYNIFAAYKGFLLDNIFVCLCHYNLSTKVFKRNNIRIVFSSSDGSYFARSYFINANLNKIHNFILQHGFVSVLHSRAISDRIVSWSKVDVDYLVKCGFPKERILSLGIPRFDDIVKEQIKPEYDINKLYNIDKHESKICFFFAMHAYESQRTYYEMVLNEINDLVPVLREKRIRVFLRAHPNDNIIEYRRMLSIEAKENIIIPDTSFPLIQLLKQMNLHVLPWSTAIIEAMICKVPVIFLNYDHYWNRYGDSINIGTNYYGYEISEKYELLPIIEKALFNQDYRSQMILKQNKYIENNIFNLGSASQAITEYIINLHK